MAASTLGSRMGPNPFLDMIEALADRHGEVDFRLEHLTLRLPLMPEPIEVNGAISVSVHLRALTDKEKVARAAKEIRILQK
jgi:hypothetical protein